MTKNLRIANMALVLLLTIPGMAWAQQALIVQDGAAGDEANALTGLTAHLTTAGFTVTNSVGVPGSLVSFQQVWDIRFNNTTPLTVSDITAYTGYLAGGGLLFVIGENNGFATRNNSIATLVSSVGGGAITVTTAANAETVLAPFTGPTPLATVAFLAAGGVPLPPGRGTAITRDAGNMAASVLFAPGAMLNAPAGNLILVFDINFLEPGEADANALAFTDNLISYPRALIVQDGTGGIEADALGNLTAHLTADGFKVTSSVGVTGSLAGFQQVWDIRFNNTTPLSGSDISAYTGYLAAGGSLFVMGENTGFATRNNSMIPLVSSAGGGVITVASANGTQTVMPPFTGPTPLATLTYLAAAGVPPGRGGAVTHDSSGIASAVVWGPGALSSAQAGSLILVFDVNFMQAGADANSQMFINNLIRYLGRPTFVPATHGSPHDLDGDGKLDLVWRQTQTGDVAAWLMNGAAVKQAAIVAPGVPLAWQIVGVGDLDGDGKADLIWREMQTGDVYVSLMFGAAVRQTLVVSFGLPLAWQIVGVADVDGDGKADLIWRQMQTGDVAVWRMNGAMVIQASIVAPGVPLAWQIVGVGDLDGDGRADLIWRHTQTGDVAAWLLNGAVLKQASIVAPGVPLAWQIVGVGDLDGDGQADLVWRQTQTGDVGAWLMNGAALKQVSTVVPALPLAWQIGGVGDLDGDGKADLIWRETQTGTVGAWLMNGVTVTQASTVASGLSLLWQIQ